MMTTKRGLLIIAVLLTVAVWAMPVQSQTIHEGFILSLSTARMITIDDGRGGSWLFAVTPETIIRRNSRRVMLEDLSVGDGVTVLANDTRMAILIEAKSRL